MKINLILPAGQLLIYSKPVNVFQIKSAARLHCSTNDLRNFIPTATTCHRTPPSTPAIRRRRRGWSLQWVCFWFGVLPSNFMYSILMYIVSLIVPYMELGSVFVRSSISRTWRTASMAMPAPTSWCSHRRLPRRSPLTWDIWSRWEGISALMGCFWDLIWFDMIWSLWILGDVHQNFCCAANLLYNVNLTVGEQPSVVCPVIEAGHEHRDPLRSDQWVWLLRAGASKAPLRWNKALGWNYDKLLCYRTMIFHAFYPMLILWLWLVAKKVKIQHRIERPFPL